MLNYHHNNYHLQVYWCRIYRHNSCNLNMHRYTTLCLIVIFQSIRQVTIHRRANEQIDRIRDYLALHQFIQDCDEVHSSQSQLFSSIMWAL